MKMKVKVINGNLVFGGKVYARGACLEVTEDQAKGLAGFVSDCDCGCGEHKEVITQQAKPTTQGKKKKKKDCKTC